MHAVLLTYIPYHPIARSMHDCMGVASVYKACCKLQVHGSAPDIAGQDKANPMAMVLSAAMMCRYGLQLPQVTRPLHISCSMSFLLLRKVALS